MRPGRGRAVRGVPLQQDEAGDRLQRHQADRRMEGLVLAHRHGARRHVRGQCRALLGGDRHHGLLEGRIQPLLTAVSGADERRQAAELQALANQTHTAAGAQGDDELHGQHQPMQPAHARFGGAEGGQGRRHLGRDYLRLCPVPQGTARAPDGASRRALALTRRAAPCRKRERLCPLQACRDLHRPAASQAAGGGLKSVPAEPSSMFLHPRLACTSKGRKFRRFCHLPSCLSTGLGFGRSCDQGPAMYHNAAACILAHNHPSGVAEPSQADLRITHKMKEALNLVEVRVLDHMIVGEGAVFLRGAGVAV